MLLLIFVALFCFSSIADGVPILDCGSKLGSYSRVQIAGCDTSDQPCVLHKGKNASIEIDFTTYEDATDLKAVVHGTVMIVPIPFDLPNADACQYSKSGITCPMRKGQSYKYKAELPVSTRYPSVSVKVKWELQDQDGNDIVCIKLPAVIR
ncbi:NPC intracellular cholesterol transporter 2 homolog a-like [Neodiprion virginianus]|uniref:NPC intracellular cholesterol transporter 2 homolog a-like n=1 Tax=Neodiprion fabricii TaxID=2872261 RepID=UPI001ED8D4DB|nr:NPC intracellular cholesterol transporter 2 homolog a-like [Neodiprion fabricii]XP_046625000.1 NPC intracellular cholesterol transporter 2 homolog a-like [Neodiprion virginianus]